MFRDPDSRLREVVFDLGAKYRVPPGERKCMVPGWCICADDEDDNEAFSLEIACELIGETEQRGGLQVVHLNDVK